MKKNAIISILSSAVILSSAAASVYASAVNIAPVQAPVSFFQTTTVPTYPATYSVDDYEEFTIPESYGPTGPTEPPTDEYGSPYVYEYEKISVYYTPDKGCCSLDYWLKNYPEEAKEATVLIVRYQPANMDEIREECDKAGKFMRDSEDPDFLRRTEGMTQELSEWFPGYGFEDITDAQLRYIVGYSEKFYECIRNEGKKFCTENGLTFSTADALPPLPYYIDENNNKIYDNAPGFPSSWDGENQVIYPADDGRNLGDTIEIICKGTTSNAIAAADDENVSALAIDVYGTADIDEDYISEPELTYIDPYIETMLANNPDGCMVFINERTDPNNITKYRNIAAIADIMRTGNMASGHSFGAEDMLRLRDECNAISGICERNGIEGDKLISRDGYIEAFLTREEIEAVAKDKGVYAISSVEQPERPTEEITAAYIATEATSFAGRSLTKGDANCDGKVTVSDCVTVLQYIANMDKYPLSKAGLNNADIDGCPGLSGGDVIAIQKIDAGIAYWNYSTKEEFIDLLVSDDPEFSDHGLIYAPGLKFDAVLNAGSQGNRRDVLIIYGPKYPDDIDTSTGYLWNGDEFSWTDWDSIFKSEQINSADYTLIGYPVCFSGTFTEVRPHKNAAIKTGEYSNIRIAFFIEGLPVGKDYRVKGSENWGIEEFKNYLMKPELIIEKPTDAC